MRLRSNTTARPAAIDERITVDVTNVSEPACLLREPLKRAPSQKELASVLGITTRQLRRLENAESTARQPCCRPYTAADLWRLCRQRHPKKWNRSEAERLGLASLLAHFEELLGAATSGNQPSDQTSLVVLMLQNMAWHPGDGNVGALPLPRTIGLNLAQAARQQLQAILACPAARETLARAFFEAALLADAHPTLMEATPQKLTA